MHTQEQNFYNLIILICILLAVVLIYFFYSIIKYHKRDLKDKLELFYGKNGIIEEEKEKLGRELHDGVSSSLAGVKLMIESLEVVTNNDEQRKINISTALDQILINLRTILNGLMEVNIKNKLLSSVLKDYIDRLNSNVLKGKLIILYDINFETELGLEKSNHIYRIFQEVIANCLKHSNAELLKILVKENEGFLEITFQDNGNGFDTDVIYSTKKGIGLNNIMYRTEILNGKYSVHSEIGIGSEIIIKIPL